MENENLNQNNEEIIIEKYNLKSWFKSCFLGFFIGIAVIIPGISGATISIIFKLYEKLVYAISNILKKFKICFLFLLPIIIGGIIGFVAGFFSIKELLNLVPFTLIALFAGLMCGSSPAIFSEISNTKPSKTRIFLLILGILIPVTMTVVTTLCKVNDNSEFLDSHWYQYIICIILGFVVAITQIVPGLSATSFLMSVGYFNNIVNSVSLTFWREHPLYILIYVCLGIGFLIGLVVISKLISYIFKKAKVTAFYMISGFVIGSIFAMFFNPDIYSVYLSWANGSVNYTLDLTLGIILFFVGFAIAFIFYKYEKKKKTLQN